MTAASSKGEGLFFLIALLVVVVLILGFLVKGVIGVGLVMVIVTPIMLLLFVVLSAGG